MRIRGVVVLILVSGMASAADNDRLRIFFKQLSELEFEKARQSARLEPDDELRPELIRLADILDNGGQADRPVFDYPMIDDNTVLAIVRKLEMGYVNLYYDQVKGNAFKEFYSANQLAKTFDDDVLVKTCLLAMLAYYGSELVLSSDAYLAYLKQYQLMARDTIDKVWTTIYQSVFQSKDLRGRDSSYFALRESFSEIENILKPESPVLAHVYFEQAIQYQELGDVANAEIYWQKVVTQAKGYKFLRHPRFAANIKLMMIAARRGQFERARRYLSHAKEEVNQADTLKSNYYLYLYSAMMLHEAGQDDSAFLLLNKAHTQTFLIDFQKSTLEVNRLNVELDTQEKENTNLKLTQIRNWLISGIAGLGLLAAMGYLVYRNRLVKSSIQIQQKEMHSMKLEKQLKDQEIAGIDHMIEAQEKERQRIANELHDNLGSHLASVKLYFENLKQQGGNPNQGDLFRKTDELLEEAYQKVRTLAHARNVGVNSKDGLMPAVKVFASRISGANKLLVDVEEHGMDTRLENSMEILLFRIIQELTTNVIKHAKATELTISLTRHNDLINLMVEDNGRGFDISQIKPADTMGLHSIQKRVENLGGRVTIDSIVSSGTTVIVDLPI